MEKNWLEIRERAGEYARENMLERGMNCAEAVYSALQRSGALDVPPETVAYATGFGGGGGGTGMTCGALSAAILANNIVHGRKSPSPDSGPAEMRQRHYPRVNNMVRDFVKVSGSGLCREIIEPFEQGYKDDATRSNCVHICGEAAKIAVDYLQIDEDAVAELTYEPSVIGIKNWL